MILRNYTEKIKQKVVKKTEMPKTEQKSDVEEVDDEWDDKLYLPIILKENDPKAYELIETVVKREA